MLRRIAVRGTSGAGKSTLARTLSERLGVPYVELDALHHGPNWTPATADELRARVLALLDDETGWVVDGNYDSKLGTLVVDRAQLIVLLDLPLTTKLARLIRRTARRYLGDEELWNGNREKLLHVLWGRDALIAWAIRSHFGQRRRSWSDEFGSRLVRLSTVDAVNDWLSGVHGASKPT